MDLCTSLKEARGFIGGSIAGYEAEWRIE